MNRCSYMIESNVKVRGKVWWRRQCKRPAAPGTDRCWQHKRPEPKETREP